MSLRIRLILAFFALAVVPLAAMTWFTYVSNERALRDAAAHESDLLASELSQRMQLITTQLSERVDNLMDMETMGSGTTGTSGVQSAAVRPNSTSSRPPASPASSSTASPAASASPNATAPRGGAASGSASGSGSSTAAGSSAAARSTGDAAVTEATMAATEAALEAEIADRLGDAAMLLNNVEIRGLPPDFNRGRGGRRGGPGGSRSSQGGAQGAQVVATRPPGSRSGPQGASASPSSAPAPVPAPAPAPPGPPRTGAAPSGPSERGALLFPAPGEGNVGPNPPSAPAPPSDRITIDLSALRREMFEEIAPGRSFESMDSAERMRVIAEINQRLLGIRQGLRLGAAEIQKQAEEAKRASAEPIASAPPAAPASRGATPAPAAAAPAPPAAATPAARSDRAAGSPPAAPPTTARPPSPSTSRGSLTGNRLNVRRERDGVVRQVNAEVNLPDLLGMVFSATPRDRGEVPFALDKSGRVYAPSAKDRSTVESLEGVQELATGEAMQLPEWIVVTTPDPTGSGLKFGIARPVGQALNDIRRTAARSAGLGLLFIGATLLLIVPLSAGLTRNLSRLNEGVHQIAGGDYATRVKVGSRDEIGQLAQAFNQMAEDVEKHQRTAVGQERLKRELELGREIQSDMLPQVPLRIGRTEVRGTSTAAGQVGGDFFNYFALKTGQIALLVGDVAGKGVGAALLMANIQASLRTRLALGQDLTSLADELDRELQQSTPETVYSTLFVGIFDPTTRQLRFVNAGHNPQYVVRRGGQLERLESSGLPVGLIAGRGYAEGHTSLDAGDVVFCYTDGCVEAENPKGDMFGADTLERDLKAAGPLDPEPLLSHMEEVLKTFRNGREPFDDATMMVLKAG